MPKREVPAVDFTNEFVRPARPDDKEGVQALLRAEALDEEFQSKEFVVVEANGRLVGCARARPLREGGTEFSSLVVVPELRGRGLARSLFQMALLGARHPVYALTLTPDVARRAGFDSIQPVELPPSLQRKAAAQELAGRRWTPMRLRRQPVVPLMPEPVGEPDFLET